MTKTLLIYVYPNGVWGMPNWSQYVDRFVRSYWSTIDNIPHDLLVVVNGDTHHSAINPFKSFENVRYLLHDDAGWDVGAYLAGAKWAVKHNYDMVVLLNTSCSFHRLGWLNRMLQIFTFHRQSLYGSTASYESGPHLRGTGLWCDPQLLTTYPYVIDSEAKRMQFESGSTSINVWAEQWKVGARPVLITWDKGYYQHQWRDGDNIFRRGNQSNILVRDRQVDIFDLATQEEQFKLSALADGRQIIGGQRGSWTGAGNFIYA